MPVSLCRSGGCGGSFSSDDSIIIPSPPPDASSIDAVSAKIPNPSIGEASVDRESSTTVGTGTHRLEVQADLASAQRFSISSLSESTTADDGAASTRALAGSVLNYNKNGSDSCSCVTTEDCAVRFDDNISFVEKTEKTSIGSSCSFRGRCAAKARDTLSGDSICIDMVDEKPRKSQAAILRSQFFYPTMSEAAKSVEEKTIIEVSNETLDKGQINDNEETTIVSPPTVTSMESSKL